MVADVIEGYNVEDCVKLMEFEEFEMCLRNKGHSLEDILISTNGQMNSTYRMTSYGPEHVLKLAQGQIKSSLITIKEDKFYLSLNNSLGYHIGFVDPHFHVTNLNPAATPLTFLKIGSETETWLYLKVINISTADFLALSDFL